MGIYESVPNTGMPPAPEAASSLDGGSAERACLLPAFVVERALLPQRAMRVRHRDVLGRTRLLRVVVQNDGASRLAGGKGHRGGQAVEGGIGRIQHHEPIE